jgi:hypothetical protein
MDTVCIGNAGERRSVPYMDTVRLGNLGKHTINGYRSYW